MISIKPKSLVDSCMLDNVHPIPGGVSDASCFLFHLIERNNGLLRDAMSSKIQGNFCDRFST